MEANHTKQKLVNYFTILIFLIVYKSIETNWETNKNCNVLPMEVDTEYYSTILLLKKKVEQCIHGVLKKVLSIQ